MFRYSQHTIIYFCFQIRVNAFRAEDSTVRAVTIVRVSVVRNANAPIFTHGNLDISISEDQEIGTTIGQVVAQDADDVSIFKLL